MISVIICHHRGTLIHKAIESFRKSKQVDFELIVATSDEALKLEGVKVLYIKGGPAYKRNVATRFAKGDWFAFFDDDVTVLPLTLFELLRIHILMRAGMTFGKLLNMEFHNRFDEAGSFLTPTGFLWSRAESGILDQGQYDQVEPVLAGKSAACLVSRKAFWEVGGFDASYEILGEETDLSWRIWLAGFKVFYCPSSITYHAFNTRFKPADFYIPKRVYFNGCRNYISMLLTNLGNNNLAFPIFCQLNVWLFAAMGMLIAGKFEAGAYILKGIGWVFFHLPQIFAKRRKVQSSRKVSDKELFPFIRKNPPASYYINRFLSYIKTGRHG